MFTPFDYAPPGCPECVMVRGEPCVGCNDCHDRPITLRTWNGFNSRVVRIANKEHICDFCNQSILKGQQYAYDTNMVEDDGEKYFSHIKHHMTCENLEECS